jgi:signal peptidase I
MKLSSLLAAGDDGPKAGASSSRCDMLCAMGRPMGILLLFGLLLPVLVSGCGGSGVVAVRNAGSSVASRRPEGSTASQVFVVSAGSMEPTLPLRARVVVKRGTRPAVGAIVVVHPPEGSEVEECGPKPHLVRPGGAACDAAIPRESRIELIERIVAGPGDEIYIRDGHVYRKAKGSGEFIHERDWYTRACGIHAGCNFLDPIKIPSGQWFLMGDNRGESDDSRFWGPVPRAWIVGSATHVVVRSIKREASSEARTGHPRAIHMIAEFAACMRENGVNIPPPTRTRPDPQLDTNGVRTRSPIVRAASVKCRHYLRVGAVGG